MKGIKTIYSEGQHSWAVISRDSDKPGHIIDTNEYIVISGDEILLLDPGGLEIFPSVFGALCSEFDPSQIKGIFASHQDPDIISSLNLWLSLDPKIKCYTSWLWTSFIPHFGGEKDTFVNIPDAGMEIEMSHCTLTAVPAHYLHSAGNFNLYDPKAKILFSGDLGAALMPEDETYFFVEDFDKHVQYMKGFHQRWMGSVEAKRRWCAKMHQLDVDMMCPQHGAVFRGDDVMRFVNWFSELEIGIF